MDKIIRAIHLLKKNGDKAHISGNNLVSEYRFSYIDSISFLIIVGTVQFHFY